MSKTWNVIISFIRDLKLQGHVTCRLYFYVPFGNCMFCNYILPFIWWVWFFICQFSLLEAKREITSNKCLCRLLIDLSNYLYKLFSHKMFITKLGTFHLLKLSIKLTMLFFYFSLWDFHSPGRERYKDTRVDCWVTTGTEAVCHLPRAAWNGFERYGGSFPSPFKEHWWHSSKCEGNWDKAGGSFSLLRFRRL